jgi:cell division protein FtsA
VENKKIIAVIDLGTCNLKCAIFSFGRDGLPQLVSFSKKKTKGIHNSIIVNLNDAIDSIRSCLIDVEKKSQISLNKINVLIDPTETITTRLTKFKKIGGSKIEKNDVSFLLKEAKKQVELNNSRLSNIHIFNYKYVVDNKLLKDLPSNIYVDQFSQENVFLSVPKNILKNISKVFHSCDIEIDKFISCSYALGICCFNQDQIDYGCGIVDIGYEKTSLSLFKDLSLVHSSSFPIGSNHITKDISRGCYLSKIESELIKKDISIIDNLDEELNNNEFLPDKYFSETKFRKISSKFVKDIISARLDEILNKIFKEINFLQAESIKQNLIFTGEGSRLNDLKKIINIKLPNYTLNFNSDNYKSSTNIDRELLSCYGAIRILTEGFVSEAIAIPNKSQKVKNGFFTRIFNIFN